MRICTVVSLECMWRVTAFSVADDAVDQDRQTQTGCRLRPPVTRDVWQPKNKERVINDAGMDVCVGCLSSGSDKIVWTKQSPCRFLSRNNETNEWRIASYDVAREKVCQALRGAVLREKVANQRWTSIATRWRVKWYHHSIGLNVLK